MNMSARGRFQAPRFRNPVEMKEGTKLRKKAKKKKKKRERKGAAAALNPESSSNPNQSIHDQAVDIKSGRADTDFSLQFVMKAGFHGGEKPTENMAANTKMERRPKYHVFNFIAVLVPFLFMMVPLVPCWQRDAHGLQCSASGSASAVFILVWNCLVSFLLGLHYAGMLLTVGTLLSHCEGMARVMRSLVRRIESIDQLEKWHITMWSLHQHMQKRIRPFKALIICSALFGILFTMAAVSLDIAHFSVSDKKEVNDIESAWIQTLFCALTFALPSVFLFAFAAQVNSILSKAVDVLDATGGGQEISLAEYYSTVIEHW
eukprot:CAMPEP_0184501670 /NCGR_PEP_ID=MMETSP0113_2-20130426/48275_1 /TAXON_ID=91329 /ORGANISM="Norrisiella sphaerica, Strain BC52" /LENGTH=317 /DNA_ID=CAMNT_0026890507 /DNA_START=278 /DNA_END=1228 /DNA_ORIENTATION=+